MGHLEDNAVYCVLFSITAQNDRPATEPCCGSAKYMQVENNHSDVPSERASAQVVWWMSECVSE